MYKPIQDYAIIGNLRSAALVSKDGSIDWAPAPYIDSPSVFGAILDEHKGGTWQITTEEEYESHQWYEGDTNVLVTQFKTKSGTLEVTDFIPIEKEKTFVPAEKDTTFRVHRKVVCTEGNITVRMLFKPRFDYARGTTEVTLIEGGLYAKNKKMHGVLASHEPFIVEDNIATAVFALKEGESRFFIFRYNTGEVIFSENGKEHHEKELEETKKYWDEWVHSCDLKVCPVAGEWHGAVVRSSLLLKVLFFEPIGTIAAAPTTSLPEAIGGERNWDYRFTWVRDASFTLSALFQLGYIKEAEEFMSWVMSVCKKSEEDGHNNLKVIYSLHGDKNLPEKTLDHLEGYKKSKPVRIGNGAYQQKQWDIYGGILDTVWTIHNLREHHVLSEGNWDILRSFTNHVVHIWREPDEGLWEVRGEKRHYVYSKVMCWVALDRAIKIAHEHNLSGEVDVWEKERELLKKEIMRRGFSEKKQTFTQSFDSEDLDVSVLTFPVLGFIEGTDPKMISTIEAVEKGLGLDGKGLLCRYLTDDGLSGKEGAFFLASFWLVDALILAGKKERAAEIFEYVLSHANHVGLFSEEIDPKTKDFLGNFPQAYTHIGLINSAFNLIRSF